MRNTQIGMMIVSVVFSMGLSGCGGGGGNTNSPGAPIGGPGNSATSYAFVKSFGIGQLNQPEGLALDSAGNIYVADVNNTNSTGSITKFTPSGVFISSFASVGSGGSSVSLPIGIAIAPDNSIRVMASNLSNNSGQNNENINNYSNAGQFQSSFPVGGLLGFTQDSLGFSYTQGTTGKTSLVTKQSQGVIAKYNSSGSQVASFGASFFESINPQASSPHEIEDVAVATDGSIYVDTQIGQDALYKFDAGGKLVGTYGTIGAGTLNGPEGITVDAKGNVYVIDAGNNRVVKFQPDGTFITSFGSQGSGNGQFRFDALVNTPNSANFDNQGIVVAPNGTVYVSDAVNQRVLIFAPQ